MLSNIYNTAYKAAAYPVIAYTFFAGTALTTAVTLSALQSLNDKSKPTNNCLLHLKISAGVGITTGLLISCLAARILLKD